MKFTYETFLRSLFLDHLNKHIFPGKDNIIIGYVDNTIGHILGNTNLDIRVGWHYFQDVDTQFSVIGKV